MHQTRSLLFLFAVLCGVFVLSLPEESLARAGGGFSSGSRGMRSYSSPSRSYGTPMSPQTRPYAPSTGTTPQASPMGGFGRGLAGGLLGGMLGSFLFGGMGYAGGMGAGGGMGFGLLDLLLLGGIAYVIFSMVRKGRERQATASAYYGGGAGEARGGGQAVLEPPAAAEDRDQGIAHIRQMDGGFNPATFTEWCTDAFFRIQAGWMRRDPEGLRPLLTDEMLRIFRDQIEASRRKGEMNKLENITVRSVEITEAWQEHGQDYATVRFLANLLDYTVSDATGAVVAGSNSEPVKFEEFWTFTRPVGPNPWRLTAIQQAE